MLLSILFAGLSLLAEQPPIATVPPPPPPPPTAPFAQQPWSLPQPIDADRWISADDYPSAALRAEAEGTVAVRYTVGTDGRVAACETVQSSGHLSLDQATCLLLATRGRFRPALDFDGRPVAHVLRQRIAWRLPPPDGPVRFVAGFVALTVPTYSEEGGDCDMAATARALVPLASDLCLDLFSRDERAASRPRTARRYSLAVLRLTGPDGALPREPQPQGRIAYRQEARFEVAPDGTTVGCRRTVTLPSPRRGGFDLCRFLAATEEGPYFAPDPAAASPRPARVVLEVYDIPAVLDARRI